MRRRRQPGEARPRIKIHRDGRATLSGVHYQDLRWIFASAAVRYYDELKKKLCAEDRTSFLVQLRVMDALHSAVDTAIQATCPVTRRSATKEERRKKVREERTERVLLDGLLAALQQEAREKKTVVHATPTKP